MQRSSSRDSLDTTETNDTFPEVDFLGTLPSFPDQDDITDFRKEELEGLHDTEPLLREDKSRFVLFPIQHNDVSL
jgi:hypothetical protein